MAKVIRALMAASVAACLLLLAACSSEPTPSPSPSPPAAELHALAERYRTDGEARAWWVNVPPSDASRLLDEPMSAFDGDTYLVILYGDYTGGDGEPCPWAYAAAGGRGDGTVDDGRASRYRRPALDSSRSLLARALGGALMPNKRVKLARQSVAARRGRDARSLSAVRWAERS